MSFVLVIVGKVNLKQVYEIAKFKQTDPHLEHIPLPGLCRTIIAVAKSMGVEVEKQKKVATKS